MRKSLNLFVSVYGAEAGNLALRGKATGGVYIGGGIAPKILAKLEDGTFMRAFLDKGRYRELLSADAGASYLERPGRASGCGLLCRKIKKLARIIGAPRKPRHSAGQGMSLEERRHRDEQLQ